MMNKSVIAVCLIYFAATVSAADRCWSSNCQNTTTCDAVPVDCTPEVALKSVEYLNLRYNNSISNSTLSKNYDCFVYGTYSVVWYASSTNLSATYNVSTYTTYKSCIPKNVDVCHLGKQNKAALSQDIITGAFGGSTCNQCSSNMCNSSGSIVKSWKIVSAVLLSLFLAGFSSKL